MTWRPLDRLPTPLEAALCDAVRATVLRRDVGRGIARDADDMLVVPMDGGGTVRVSLAVTGEASARFGPRQAVRVELQGRAVAGRTGYGLAASAVVDVKTRCFVEVRCDVTWRDDGLA